MALTLSDSVEVVPDVVFRELDGEAVILNLDSGTYFGLDEIGTRIWTLIREHGALQPVFDTLQREFDVDPATLEEDLLALVSDLCLKGLSRVGGGPA